MRDSTEGQAGGQLSEVVKKRLLSPIKFFIKNTVFFRLFRIELPIYALQVACQNAWIKAFHAVLMWFFYLFDEKIFERGFVDVV
ncbi:hypothetical protein LNQ82_03835 [Conchiformibius steedae DSM 2580]|uniref:Uncharacterized protein n=1 Tax=Conchiformibius steedae DSM 2580 TaxID=1121352 RepID=A0AAE9I0L2_9NEIS|nr:hypothetical protein [Conchiformibius steedae]QMT33639.1 hypothetical protein H3L98_00910 [Conchiformibius steedae]URD68296.1 hypothetical protein LNQ82_03835 [Conchiformibius steedae DSM 2580]